MVIHPFLILPGPIQLFGILMDDRLPRLMLTGVSGFECRHFIEAVCQNVRLFCVARRSEAEVRVQANNNLRWIKADIADWAYR